MARRRFLIAYDICDPTRLRHACKAMEEYGERLQYSVFICDLSRAELVHARAKVEKQMNLREDSVVIVDLGETSARGPLLRPDVLHRNRRRLLTPEIGLPCTRGSTPGPGSGRAA